MIQDHEVEVSTLVLKDAIDLGAILEKRVSRIKICPPELAATAITVATKRQTTSDW
jgi:hypothetical protein